MVTNRIRRHTFAIACAASLAALGTGVLGGATATADSVATGDISAAEADISAAEAAFIEEISVNDATLPGKSTAEMIDAGYETCGRLRAGGSILDEMSAVEHDYGFDRGVLFVSAATTNLCPDFAS
ncbi:MAG TPA: DUF732 domain-containing protein [Nocardia sp.]|uniref:DUF732 domain-containing protein n=1 Tax=Nocardia sp. TaxID=1821 RepID=UPI002B4B807B|nr:DUF732 domain-containing protein [Nocardia sp.]HLS78534.1 DUF732 domain-containing protein [Nocardia sp.]